MMRCRVSILAVCAVVGGGAVAGGCGRATVVAPPRPDGRGTFEFVRAPHSPDAASAKPVVQETTAQEEWLPPRAVGKLAEPVYPAAALAAGAGPVTMGMRVVVDAEGKVTEVAPSVRAWSTPTPWAAEFHAAIEATVAQWRFRPAEVRHFTTVTNAEGTYRSVTGVEKTEWALHVTFSFSVRGGVVVETQAAAKGK